MHKTIKEKKEEALNAKIKVKYPRIRGMKDIMFDEYRYFDFVQKKAADIANAYGFKRLEVPILEKTELYERASGKTSDVVLKEMYNFTDRGGEKVALRPEATPSLARAYVEHGLFNMPQPVK
ncbi:MAG: ATP phosphoribosyltransferase regulatory subunit, partial [Candidatus Falkowbacteria bacterium]|nr:ATP phosphoribosyltransferase regulatory subunit [Candidatus Falkowbacteria bacterium]